MITKVSRIITNS